MKIPENLKITKYELLLTEDCNLRCTYCFDNYLSDRTSSCGTDNVMSFDIIPDLFHFINKTRGEKISFNLFGGEPLSNWKFFTAFVSEVRSMYGFEGVEISTVSNATLLNTAKINFLKDNRVGIAISIDGDKTGNVNRIDKSGNNSWEKVVQILPEVKAKLGNINIFMVVNESNYKNIYNSYKFLLNFDSSIELLIEFHNDWMTEDILKEIENIFLQLFLVERQPLFRQLDKYLDEKYINGANNFCGSALDSISINPKGDLFFCHQFMPKLNDDFDGKLYTYGNIKDGIIYEDRFNGMHERTQFNEWSQSSKCTACPAKSWCKGGCLAEHYNYKNSESLDNMNENICNYNLMLNNIIIKLKE